MKSNKHALFNKNVICNYLIYRLNSPLSATTIIPIYYISDKYLPNR